MIMHSILAADRLGLLSVKDAGTFQGNVYSKICIGPVVDGPSVTALLKAVP